MKKRNIIFLCIFVFVMSIGASFAWYVWQGANVNVNVAFSSLDRYLNYRVVNIDSGENEVTDDSGDAVATKIEYQKKEIAKNLDVFGNIYLDIDNVSNNLIFQESNLTWEFKAVKDDVTTIISTGNFVGEAIGEEKIPIAINIILDENTEYIFSICWPNIFSGLCQNIPSDYANFNVSGMTLTTSITSVSTVRNIDSDGNVEGMLDELYIREIQYSSIESSGSDSDTSGSGTSGSDTSGSDTSGSDTSGSGTSGSDTTGNSITSISFYSSISEVTHYMITTDGTTPTLDSGGWISYTGSNTDATLESGYVGTISISNNVMADENNICVKNSNEVYCKSLENIPNVNVSVLRN